MPDVQGLSVAFAESHPGEAARVLEALPPPDTAEFVAALTPPLAASILKHIASPYGARVLEQLDDERAAAVLQIMGPQPAARLIERYPDPRQVQLLARLPVASSIAIRLLIGYPKGTCGACMDPWPLAVSPDMAAAEAWEQVRSFEGDLGDCVFVTNGQKRLLGVLSLTQLVKARPREPLSAIMRPVPHTVSALASASLLANHPGWEEFHVMPVVERENRLVGALHRHGLNAALAVPARPEPNVASGLFGTYWRTVAAFSEVLVGALPPVPPVNGQRKKS